MRINHVIRNNSDEESSGEDRQARKGREIRDWRVRRPISPNLAAPVDAAAIARIQADNDRDVDDERDAESQDLSG